MPTHKVTYTTTDKPDVAKLPPGARVETVSAFPVSFQDGARELTVRRLELPQAAARRAVVSVVIRAGESRAPFSLTADEARELAGALLQAADNRSPVQRLSLADIVAENLNSAAFSASALGYRRRR